MISDSEFLKVAVKRLLPAGIVTRIRLRRLRRRITNFDGRVVHRRMGTSTFALSIEDPMAAAWYDHDSDELPEVTLLRNYSLKPGAVVFDIGAHQAVVALALAAVVGTEGRVIAVEANEHNAAVARRNVELNNMDKQITVVQAAGSNKLGKLVFNEGLNGHVDDGSGTWGQVEVDTVTIDSLSARFGRPNLIFLDVEGFEVHVVRGARSAIESGVDFFIEVHAACGLERFGATVADLAAQFDPSTYRLLMLCDDAITPRPFDVDDPMTQHRFYLLALAESTPIPA